MKLDKEKLDRIEEEIKSCGEWAKEEQQKLNISVKKDHTLVTNVDIGISKRLLTLFKTLFPEARIITEEEVTENVEDAPFSLVLDPIDGTDIYSQGFPSFCIAFAIMDKLFNPVGAIIYAPRFGKGNDHGLLVRLDPEGELLVDGNPFIYEKKEGEFKQLTAASTLINFDLTHYKGKIRTFGSTILNSLSPAIFHRVDGTLCERSYVWDYAASHAVLKKVGLDFFRPNGEPFKYSSMMINREKNETNLYVTSADRIEELRALIPMRT